MPIAPHRPPQRRHHHESGSFVPFPGDPGVKIPCHAVWEATGTDAASSNERLDGFLAMAAALTARYSAYAPPVSLAANTASPGAYAATSLPICSTTPENS